MENYVWEFVTENELSVEKFSDLLLRIFSIKMDADTNKMVKNGNGNYYKDNQTE